MTTRLPVIGSTAASTAFCSARLDGPGWRDDEPLHLWFDGNGKITAGNGTLLAPRPNAFSLPAAGVSGIEHCPQSTPTCRKDCYVESLSAAQPATYALYEHNAITIRKVLEGTGDHPKYGFVITHLALEWAERVAIWIEENAAEGFRWHVSGDTFSRAYAEWIAQVCRLSPNVRHWIYTRSFDFLEPLAEVSTLRAGNLAINLSCDADNYEAAKKAANEHGWDAFGWNENGSVHTTRPLRLNYLTVDGKVPNDLGPDDVIFPTYTLRPKNVGTLAESEWWQSLTQVQRGLVCPVDAHGKAENRRCGPCDRCLK